MSMNVQSFYPDVITIVLTVLEASIVVVKMVMFYMTTKDHALVRMGFYGHVTNYNVLYQMLMSVLHTMVAVNTTVLMR